MNKNLVKLSLLFLPFYFNAQEVNISGKVISENGEKISGVNITDKTTGKTFITNENGNFSITANVNDILEFYAPDFSSYTFKIGDKKKYSIVLKKASDKVL